MNRFKKEIRKRGWMLETDYECLPSDDGTECVICDAEEAVLSSYHVSAGWQTIYFGSDLEPSLVTFVLPDQLMDKVVRC